MEAGPDLMSIGQHCSVEDCRQRDFLPFVCDCCQATFCLDHRTYGAHRCPKAGGKESLTIVCPICAKAIKCEGEDPHMAFERHSQQGCDPSNYDKVHRKPKCPVPGCSEKLSTINTYRCKNCHQTICLKHRFPADHKCKAQSGPTARKQSGLTMVQNVWNGLGLQTTSKPTSTAKSTAVTAVKSNARASTARPAVKTKASPAPVSSNSLLETAFRRQAIAEGRRQEASGTGGPERCPLCGAGFDKVQDLIQHSEMFHGTGGTSLERCPQCNYACRDAVALVEHVERMHKGKAECVVC